MHAFPPPKLPKQGYSVVHTNDLMKHVRPRYPLMTKHMARTEDTLSLLTP